ncbi:MAG: DUF4292 domain-containing protein [Dysgonomonas sp.]
MRRKSLYIIASVCLALLFLNSCHSKKSIVTADGKLIEKSQNELISDVLDQDLKYRTITAKTSLELLPINSKKGTKVTANIKTIKDSVIQISVRLLFGIEGARITLTPDSVYFIDRYHKQYAIESISKAKSSTKGVSFNFYNLQALLTNGLFLPGEKDIDKSNHNRFDLGTASNMYLLRTKDKSNNLYNFAIDASDRVASTLILSSKRDFTLQWSYNDFIKDGGYLYPTKMEAKVNMRNARFDVNIAYDKLDFNKDVNIDYTISEKYQRVSVLDIVKSYLKFQ